MVVDALLLTICFGQKVVARPLRLLDTRGPIRSHGCHHTPMHQQMQDVCLLVPLQVLLACCAHLKHLCMAA